MYHFHIADDHPLFRNALLGVISKDFPEVTTSQSFDYTSTFEMLENNRETDLLLLDLNMPGNQDLIGLIKLRENFPLVPLVVISATENTNTISRAMGHGASGYIPKTATAIEISEALTAVLEGETWLPLFVRGKLKSIDKEEKELAAKVATLTTHQFRVMQLIQEGLLNKQIAHELCISEATVKAHITTIFKKLGASNRTQAVVLFSNMALDNNTENQVE